MEIYMIIKNYMGNRRSDTWPNLGEKYIFQEAFISDTELFTVRSWDILFLLFFPCSLPVCFFWGGGGLLLTQRKEFPDIIFLKSRFIRAAVNNSQLPHLIFLQCSLETTHFCVIKVLDNTCLQIYPENGLGVSL